MSETREPRKQVGIMLAQISETGERDVFSVKDEIALHIDGKTLQGTLEGIKTDNEGRLIEVYINLGVSGVFPIAVSATYIQSIDLISKGETGTYFSSRKGLL